MTEEKNVNETPNEGAVERDLPQNVDEYINQQRMALAKNPDCGASHYNLGLGLLGKRLYDEAEKEFLAAVDCSPTLAEAYVQLGGIRLTRGDIDGCLDFNRRAIRSRAGFSVGYGNVGFALLQKGEVDEAVGYLRKAIAYNPKFIQALTSLANAYLMQGSVDESIETSLQALALDENFPVVHSNLALAYLEKGDIDQAVSHLEKAKALGYEVPAGLVEAIEQAQKEQKA